MLCSPTKRFYWRWAKLSICLERLVIAARAIGSNPLAPDQLLLQSLFSQLPHKAKLDSNPLTFCSMAIKHLYFKVIVLSEVCWGIWGFRTDLRHLNNRVTFIRVQLEAATAIVADNVVQSGRVQTKAKLPSQRVFQQLQFLKVIRVLFSWAMQRRSEMHLKGWVACCRQTSNRKIIET